MSTIEIGAREAHPGWTALLGGRNAVYSIVLAGGVTLHAFNIYIVTTIMPSIVGDIGGLEYYAWSTTLFVVASILGAALSSRLLDRVGPGRAYASATALFAAGAVICAAAPAFPMLLAGRFVQGLGGGLLLALAYAVVRQGRKLPVLRICADPGNMPLSNDKLEGFQNKIAAVLAEELGGTVSYFWRPYLERGLTRQTFDNRECDVLMDIPSGYERILTTNPIYRTTYVFAYRSDKPLDIKNFDDPQLNSLRIGVFQHSGLREVLVRHGVKNNLEIHIISHDADLVPENQPWRQVQKVIDGELDIAGVWGPFAGFLKTMKGAPLTIQPVNLMDDAVPLEFDLGIGMRRNDVVLKYMLDNALEARRDEIRKILEEYGVPLVQCSRCAVQGTLASHGSYFERYMREAQKRFLEAPPEEAIHIDAAKATPDQVVSSQKVDEWLKAGADPNVELGNAVLGSDVERAKFLIGKGAGINGFGAQGLAPLHVAARQRDSAMIGALLGLGADVNQRDRDGWTPLLHAVYRNHVPSIELLAKAGADLNAKAPGGFTALALTIEEGKFFAAKALLKAGASANAPSGQDDLTPMMILTSKKQASTRNTNINQSGGVLELAREVLAHGGDVNAVSKSGITALMVGASNDNAAVIGMLLQAGARADAKTPDGRTALDITEANLSKAAAGSLRLIAKP